MNKFDITFNAFYSKKPSIIESAVDLPRDSLDSGVFQFFDDGRLPILKDGIKAQIITDVQTISETVPVVCFYGIGSMFTPNYTKESDIDISVQVDIHDLNTISSSEILQSLKRLNGKLAAGTIHPINYYCMTDDYDWDKADAVYDIANERWIKSPEAINPDIGAYVVKFQETLKSIDLATGELRRNLIDFEEIRNLNTKNLKMLKRLMERKLEEIEQNMNELVNIYRDIHILRSIAFDQMLTPQEIQMYGSKNQLPENIIYKLLEKYYYIKFLKRLKETLEERGEIKALDVPRISRISKAFWTNK